MPRHIKNSKLALIGLIIPFAFSLVTANGGKFPVSYPEIHALKLSAKTHETIENAFLQSVANETLRIVQAGEKSVKQHYNFLQFVRLGREWKQFESHPLLNKIFPNINFYILYSSASEPSTAYFKASTNGNFYDLPSDFNRLLIDSGLEVTDKNIMELAKALVVLACGDKYLFFPQITFLEGTRIKEYDSYWATTMVAQIKCKIENGLIETWKFSLSKGQGMKGQFAAVTIYSGGKPIREYQIKTFVREKEKRGELDLDPEVKIATTPVGNATVEQNSFYYLITFSDGEPTGFSVCCTLLNFPANEENVYIRIRPKLPYTFGPDKLIGPVDIDGQGSGFIEWQPEVDIQTGIGRVDAGTWTQEQGFQKRTLEQQDKSLTLEEVNTGIFNGDSTYKIYFCRQFFVNHPQHQEYAPTFAGYVKDAAVESWQKQVDEWKLATFVDKNHQYFVTPYNDMWPCYYHYQINIENSGTFNLPGDECNIFITSAISTVEPGYSSEDELIQSVIPHEFYHEVQWALTPRIQSFPKELKDQWGWFIEGQARFIQSVQNPDEEFNPVWRRYATCANTYLMSLNLSLRDLIDSYCLYWRYVYEKFKTTQSPQEKLEIIREAYKWTDKVDTNPIIGGMAAIDSAFLKASSQKLCSTFAQSIDYFATACYLKDFDPNYIYVEPYVENCCTLYTINGDSIIINDSIRSSFGIDYIEFITNQKVGKVNFSFVTPNPSTACSLRFIVFKPGDTLIIPFDTLVDCREADKLVVQIVRLDMNENTNHGLYTLKAKFNRDAITDTLDKPAENGRKSDPVYYKSPGYPISLPVKACFGNLEGRDEAFIDSVIIQRDTSIFYRGDTNLFLKLDSSKMATFPNFVSIETGHFKMTAFTNLKNDQHKENDTLNGYFWIIDTGGPPDVEHKFYPSYEGFNDWPAPYWIARHWTPLSMSSCWHLRRAGQWPWGDPNNPPQQGNIDTTNYMCLRWHDRGNCYETLFTPNIVCSPYDTVKLRYRLLYWPRSTAHPCTAKVVYSIDGGHTWPYVVVSYQDYGNGYQEFPLTAAAHQARVKIAWTYYGDSSDVVAWCVDDVAVIGTPLTAFDVAAKQIVWPFDKIVPNDSQNIWYIVKNVGGNEVSNVKAQAWIGNACTQQITLQLAPVAETLIKQKITIPDEGTYPIKIVTSYEDDCCLDDDTLTDSLVVIDSFWETVGEYPFGKTKAWASLSVKENTDSIFFWGGRNIRLFYQYFPRSNQWDTLAWLPKKLNKGFLVWAGDSFIYFISKRKQFLYRFNINRDTWDTLGGTVTKKIINPSACWDKGKYIYCLRGSGQDDVYRYKISDKTWENADDLPYGYKIKRRGGITSKDSNNIYIMGIKDNMGKLLLYHPYNTSNKWDTLQSMPYCQSTKDKVRELFYLDGRVYVLRDSGYTGKGEMWYYDTQANNWHLASIGMPQFPHSKNKVVTGACLTMWQDGENHYGFVFSGREKRMFKFFPQPVPYFDEPLSQGKEYTAGNGLLLTNSEYDHYLPKFTSKSDTIICYREDTTDDLYHLSKISISGNEATITSNENNYEQPSYTPGDTYIISLKDNALIRMKRDGSGEKTLTTGLCDEPTVSPKSDIVVFSKWENGCHRLYKVPKDSGAQTALTSAGYNCSSPQFSPDGMKVVYEKVVNGFSNIYTFTLRTGQDHEVAGGDGNYFNPRFSKDGKWIASEKIYSDGKSQICRMSPDSGVLQVLTDEEGDYEYPSFTPDNEWVICVKWFSEGTAICKVPIDGGDEVILTDTSTIKLYPEISPNGNYIAYEALSEDGGGNEVNVIGILYMPTSGLSDDDDFGIKPKVFVLYQNRPNPFRNGTRIKYGLPKQSKVKLMVYNITGRAVKKLVEEEQKEGYYDIVWNGRDNRGRKLPSGVYFYRLEAEQTKLIKKVIMTK
jgi:hypothetical protein